MNKFSNKFNNLANFPISFCYDGKEYNGFAGDEFKLIDENKNNDGKKETTVTKFLFRDVLTVELVRASYVNYDFYEWSVSFENTGCEKSGVISNIKSDISLACKKPVLKGILGDNMNKYAPYEIDLTREPANFFSGTGRPTHVSFPYFNLNCKDGGAFIAIGWGGTWSAGFENVKGEVNCSVRSTPRLKAYLKKGEKISSGLFLCGLYKGDYQQSVNIWRKWFIENNMPKLDKSGAQMKPFSTVCLSNDTGKDENFGDSSASERSTTWRKSFEKMLEVGCKPDYRLIKGGWYDGSYRNEITRDWQHWVGTWEPSRSKWPGETFKETTDFARENGMKTALWFMPEKHYEPQKLVENFGYQLDWRVFFTGFAQLNGFYKEGCYEWTKNKIIKTMTDYNVEIYCEDMLDATVFQWYHNDILDDENRVGITECKFVSAHYRLWDDIIDFTLDHSNCGFINLFSGAGRNDLLSLRRAVPMFRSENDFTTTASRLSVTTSFNEWIPFCGSAMQEKETRRDTKGSFDAYTWRASYLPIINIDTQFAQDPDQDFSVLLNGIEEWKKVNPYLLKDFYVLTPWHNDEDKTGFTSYCYYDPEEEKGVLFVFRMEECGQDALNIKLPFANKKSSFTLTDEDSGEKTAVSDKFDISVPEKRQAKLIWIEKNK